VVSAWILWITSITLAALSLGLALWWGQPQLLLPLLERLQPGVIWRGPRPGKAVALSFDDGPDRRDTPAVLALLERHGARATFFLIGERARAHPELVQAIRSAGHELGNHYDSDRFLLGEDPRTFLAKLEATEAALGDGSGPLLFRPPRALIWPWQLRLLQRRGYRSVLGSAYPHDGEARPPLIYIRWLLEKNLVPGAILILHEGSRGSSRSLAALDQVLATARRRGLAVRPVGDLLDPRG
jgi:peptidoglycan/xylan/chitin deacetylase (PgdA/CDA1 family)